ASVVRPGSSTGGQNVWGIRAGEWSDKARDQSRRMVRQSQGSEQGQQRIRQEQEQEQGCRNRIQGPGETHTPRQGLQVWPSLKYTCLSSFRCLAGCRVESLIAGSTRWPALVLQPTRQVSPTTTGKSIPNTD
ncbi:unnamed protein product, partial [Staurois parvus]